MENIRLAGSAVVKAEVEDRCKTGDGKIYGTAIIDGERVPVMKYAEGDKYWYLDVGEVVH